VQLPAGTLEPGEDVYAGAGREAFEETGLDDLRFRSEVAVVAASRPGTAIINRATYVGGRVIGAGYLARVLEQDVRQAMIEVDGATGVVDLEVLSFDAVRHLVHFVVEGAAPDEWFVTTPDGGGQCWRCHWLPIDAAPTLNADQQPWFDEVRGYLVNAPHPPARRRLLVDSDVQTDLTIEMFWAPPWSGTRALISWVDPPHGPQDELIQRTEAAAFTQDGKLFVVAEGDDRFSWLSLPGGRGEVGETLEGTLRRELLEEACAAVQASELVGFQQFRHLNGERAGRVTTDAMFSVRAEVLPFEPRFRDARTPPDVNGRRPQSGAVGQPAHTAFPRPCRRC
jgi:ADP-ribose pyrophosphatase YjhB (NUDIX family)